MSLSSVQRAFFRGVVEPSAVKSAPWVRPVAPLSALERVRIYSDQYPLRTHDALLEDFPRLAKLVGAKKFARLVAAYVKAYPSTDASLGRLGHALAAWLRRQRGVRKDLADLAALEWARAEAFVAEDAPVLEKLAGIAPGDRLVLHPSVRVVKTAHDVIALWRKPTRASKPRKQPSFVLVWRKGFDVFHVEVGAPEAKALRGGTLEEICAPFRRPEDAFSTISSWVTEAIVSRIERA